eukprot:gene11201-11283_t
MLGLSDRGRLFTLLGFLFKGSIEESLKITHEMVKDGGDPVVIMQDILDLVLLKGFEEVNHSPSPAQALDMVLIRLCYMAEMPSLNDLIESFKGGDKQTSTPSVPRPMMAVPVPNGKPQTAFPLPASFEEMVKLLERSEPLLSGNLQLQSQMAEMQKRLEQEEITGTSGAGMVTVTINGKAEMKGVKIDPALADPKEIEILEDLIVAAYNDAKVKLDAYTSEEMSKVSGGLSLPGIYLKTLVGVTTVWIGFLEGMVEASSYAMKLFSGMFSDYIGRRKPIMIFGYMLSVFSRPLLAATPRDAMVADVAHRKRIGASYGLKRSLGTAGSFFGAVCGILAMIWTHNNYQQNQKTLITLQFLQKFLCLPQKDANLFIGLTFACSGRTFLILHAHSNFGLENTYAPAIMMLFNAGWCVASYPVGVLADRMNRYWFLAIGIIFIVLADLILATDVGAGNIAHHYGEAYAFLGSVVATLAFGAAQASTTPAAPDAAKKTPDVALKAAETAAKDVASSAANSAACAYISGEEALSQLRLRAERLKVNKAAVHMASSTQLQDILVAVDKLSNLKLAIIDSIQTMISEEITSAAGTVSQVRACTQDLIASAKKQGYVVILVGHVTKEGERNYDYRILRSVKNRFGATDEIGVFAMGDQGLTEVRNPSELFLANHQNEVSGTAIFAGMEGTRPILLEIQALVAPSYLASPRRTAVGWDSNRLSMILAVLEARCGLSFGNKDIYLNVAGGLKITEPAVDLAVAAALISAIKNQPVPSSSIYFGEIGLTGEVRPVSHSELRFKEAEKLGFTEAFYFL